MAEGTAPDETAERLSVWERPEPSDAPAPDPLSRARIVAAAMYLADDGGLAEVSLRKVAARLGVGPMRLYRYVPTKEDLLDLMADAVYAEIRPPRPDDDWRTALRTLANRTRQAALRREWFADLLGGRPHLGPNALAHLEASLAALHGKPGFDDIGTVRTAVGTIHAYLIGAIRQEVAELRAARAEGRTKDDWRRTHAPYLTRVLATGRYPTLARTVTDATHSTPAEAFGTGLDLLLTALTPAT